MKVALLTIVACIGLGAVVAAYPVQPTKQMTEREWRAIVYNFHSDGSVGTQELVVLGDESACLQAGQEAGERNRDEGDTSAAVMCWQQ